ncbi:MAG: sigma 54-interacting transcriptional regulator [candidate division WOR-3 bacterium]|nr:sigma 54-interacting transcriptional regulator [candidate division WOR-3 bacterium]
MLASAADLGDKEKTLLSLLASGGSMTDDFRAMFRLCAQLYSASSVKAEACLHTILVAALEAGHLQAVCLAHQRLAEVLRERGDYTGSLVQAHEVLVSARACGEPRYEASHHFLVGRVHEATGRYVDARTSYEQSLAIYCRIGHVEGERAVSNQLANLAWCEGRPGEALERYLRCLELSDESTRDEERAAYQQNVGDALQALGRWEDAVESYHRALSVTEQSSSEVVRTVSRCRVLDSLGELLARRDLVDQAIDVFEEIVSAAEKSDAVRSNVLAQALGHLGDAYRRQGNLAKAEKTYRAGFEVTSRLNDRVSRTGILRRAAELALAQGQLSVCQELTVEAIGLAKEIGLTLELAESWRVEALLHAARGEPQSARDCFERALQMLEVLDEGYELAMVRFHFGRFLMAAGDRSAGEGHLRAAARVFRGLAVVPEVEEINRLLFSEEQAVDPDMALLHAVSRLATLGLDPRRYLEQALRVICEGTRCDSGAILIDHVPQITYGRPDLVVPGQPENDFGITNTPIELSWGVWRGGASTARLSMHRSVPARIEHSRFVFEAVGSLLAPAFQRLAAAVGPARPAAVGGLKYRGVIGRSRLMLETLSIAGQVADTDVSVLIRGEGGTGKELVARALHDSARRAGGPFVAVNCAAMPESLLEAELFGVEKGVATGVAARKGKLELAGGGTVFLDEVGDMSPSLQAKLLRVLQERRFERVGGRESFDFDVRVVAATNRDIVDMLATQQFRADLYYRLNGVELLLPPLRERKEDIPELVQYFIVSCNQQYGRNVKGVQPEALSRLVAHSWPGNIRELMHAVERGVIVASGDIIDVRDLPAAVAAVGAAPSQP